MNCYFNEPIAKINVIIHVILTFPFWPLPDGDRSYMGLATRNNCVKGGALIFQQEDDPMNLTLWQDIVVCPNTRVSYFNCKLMHIYILSHLALLSCP